jgi:UDP-N-acetylglucosamine--N-acetylmuramyl-(pentapeptide) pyrophosphoryl-undecaprenol N-acetylglucosamine transferase
VYPALAVADALRRLTPDDLTMTFVGARGDMARDLVRRENVAFDGYDEVLAGPLHGVPRAQQLVSAAKILIGILQSLVLAIRRRPQVLFLTGGWVGFPMAVACWLLRRPIVIYVPDIEPGLTLRLLGRVFARAIAATVAETAQFIPQARIETGYPLRSQVPIPTAHCDRTLGSSDAERCWSRQEPGSRSINARSRGSRPIAGAGHQILHIPARDWEQVQADHAALSDEQRAHYRFSRSCQTSAGVRYRRPGDQPRRARDAGRYPELGLPAILVPCPYAWRYQKVNAIGWPGAGDPAG